MAEYDKGTLLSVAGMVRLFAASRPIQDHKSILIRGRYEGEQAACNFLATLFEQMADSDDPNLVLKIRDMG